jgi:glycosyltransferase involved in cell wall biosynthesis
MHILHISSAISWRGGEQQIAYLLRGLRAHGIKVTMMAPSGSQLAAYAVEHNFSLVVYRKLAGVDPFASRRIVQTCKYTKPDLIHIHDSHAHTYAYHAYKYMGLALPSVVSRRVTFAVKTLAKYRHPMVRRVFCDSQAVADQLLSQGIAAEKLAVLHSGVEVDRTTKNIDIYKQLDVADNTTVLTCVAALAPFKGHETLVKGFAKAVRLIDQPLHLALVGGDAGRRADIDRLIKELDMTDNITILGHQADPWSWLAASDIAIFASEKEGLGTSVIDAMAIGTPVISTAIDGLATTVINQQTALAIPPRDPDALATAITHLLSSTQLQSALIQGAKAHAQTFSVEHMVSKTIGQYGSMFF